MPQPTAGDLHVNSLLTDVSIGWMQARQDFVAWQAFPEIPTNRQSDRYAVYDRAFWYRNEMRLRSPGTESAGAGYEVDTTPNFFCDEYALHHDIADPERGNADTVFQLDSDTTEFLSLQAMLNAEIKWAADFFVPAVWTDFTPGTLWDAAGGDPIGDVDLQKEVIKGSTGYTPNTLVLGARTFRGIKNNADVIDRVKYTQRGMITLDMLAGMFDVSKVLVANAVANTAAEGVAETTAFIAGANDALLMYVEPNPGRKKPSAGYTFAWTGRPGAGSMGGRIKRFRMELLDSDRIEIQQNFDQKLVAAELGLFFENAVT